LKCRLTLYACYAQLHLWDVDERAIIKRYVGHKYGTTVYVPHHICHSTCRHVLYLFVTFACFSYGFCPSDSTLIDLDTFVCVCVCVCVCVYYDACHLSALPFFARVNDTNALRP
jgi:hypothetical protein